MKIINQLIEGLPCQTRGSTDIEVTDIVFDSRQVKPGVLFVALRGVHQDAHQFATAAVQSGARAVLCERPISAGGATVIQVKDSLQALAHVAVRFWDYPSRKLRVVGITGTNGKTTTSYLIESIFNAAGWPTGVLGTINYRFQSQVVPAPNTTPFSSELQRFLSLLVARGAQACIMEVSSHALMLERVGEVEFDVAVFTNLTQDHLDFHGTMEAYGAAKMKLIAAVDPQNSKSFPKYSIVNTDDPWGEKMASASRVPVWRCRLHGPADVYAKNIACDAAGSRFELCTPQGQGTVRLTLLGEYNVMNALTAAAVALTQGITLGTVIRGLEQLEGVPGRMERIAAPGGYTVVIDYAHTEDALRQVLQALRRLKPHKILTVFGAGGDRDRTKRPLMGQVTTELSDEVIVTSDNPRSEDPGRIALDIEVGVRRVRSSHYQIVLDREEAIRQALRMAAPGDIVLVAGKGHENYQILADRTIPFEDREMIRKYMAMATPSS